MNIRRQSLLSLGLGILVLGVASAQANAQEVYRGNFELPAATYWGNTLLQPGQYDIRMSRVSALVSLIRLQGENMRTDLLTMAQPEHRSERSYLKIVDANGVFYIAELSAGPIAKSFQFGASKAANERALSASARKSMTIPVSASGF